MTRRKREGIEGEQMKAYPRAAPVLLVPGTFVQSSD